MTTADPTLRSRRLPAIVPSVVIAIALLAQPAAAACHIAAFSQDEYQADESDGVVALTVELIGGQPGCEGTVAYETADGTARAPDDYASTSGELRFVAGDDRTETITIELGQDDIAEETETFMVILTGGTGDVSADDTATVTIADDDAPAAPTPDDTITATPTTDDTPVGGSDDDGGNGALIALLVVLAVLIATAAAILAQRRRRIA